MARSVSLLNLATICVCSDKICRCSKFAYHFDWYQGGGRRRAFEEPEISSRRTGTEKLGLRSLSWRVGPKSLNRRARTGELELKNFRPKCSGRRAQAKELKPKCSSQRARTNRRFQLKHWKTDGEWEARSMAAIFSEFAVSTPNSTNPNPAPASEGLSCRAAIIHSLLRYQSANKTADRAAAIGAVCRVSLRRFNFPPTKSFAQAGRYRRNKLPF